MLKNQSIIKHLSSLNSAQYSTQLNTFIEQISYLQVFIIVKSTRFDKIVSFNSSNGDNNLENSSVSLANQIDDITYEEKCAYLNQENKILINDLINSFGSTYKASPIILAWTTVLYNLSIDSNLSKSKYFSIVFL